MEGKVVRCLRTGDVLNDKSSFETNKKNNSERLRASVLCRNEKESTALCINPGLPGRNKKKKRVRDWGKVQGLSSRGVSFCVYVCVCVCIYDRRAGMCSTEHIQRTGWAHKMIPSWDIGVCTVMMVSMSCVLTVKAFWCKVSCRVSRCSEFGKKKRVTFVSTTRGSQGQQSITFVTFTCLTTDRVEGSLSGLSSRLLHIYWSVLKLFGITCVLYSVYVHHSSHFDSLKPGCSSAPEPGRLQEASRS